MQQVDLPLAFTNMTCDIGVCTSGEATNSTGVFMGSKTLCDTIPVVHTLVVHLGQLMTPAAFDAALAAALAAPVGGPTTQPASQSDTDALLAFRASFSNGAEALPDWTNATSVCRWTGVTCNSEGRVTKM